MNILIAFVGWLAYNFLVFSMQKDTYDDQGKALLVSEYARKYWDNWLASLFMVPILLYFGYKGLGLDVFGALDLEHLQWSDAYYPAAGFLTELVISAIKKFKTKVQ